MVSEIISLDKMKGMGMPGHVTGGFWSVLLNAYYHTSLTITFKGGDQNSFRDIKPFIQLKGWSTPRHATGDILFSVIECILQ